MDAILVNRVFVYVFIVLRSSTQNMTYSKKRENLVFRKGRELFIFAYDQGNESRLIDTIIDYTDGDAVSLNWNDAALLSSKITDRLLDKTENICRGLK